MCIANPDHLMSDWPPILLEGGGTRILGAGHQLQVAFPLGGIGAGCICFNGYGGLQDFAVRNRPATTALPDGHSHFGEAAFALLHVRGPNSATRLVEGPLPEGKIFDQGLQAQGYRKGGFHGLPRFASCEFRGAYPFAEARLRDPSIPLEVDVAAWSPLVPLDADASGMPGAVLEYRLHNPGDTAVQAELSFHASHWAKAATGADDAGDNRRLEDRGFLIRSTVDAGHLDFGSNAVLVPFHLARVKARWFRGHWFDAISMLWREVATGSFQESPGGPGHAQSANGGSVLVPLEIAPGAAVTVPVILAWHFPNGGAGVGHCTGPECRDTIPSAWSPYYATRFADAGEVALHLAASLETLRQRTLSFHRALFDSHLPEEILDAVSANLAILKSPTLLRQANGRLWGWEGCFTESGCCHGSCTHVWNYAQTLAHLFPALERGLREQEWVHSMDERGHVSFRSSLPDGPADHHFHAAADGQFGGILKLYRDWQISGDEAWLRSLLPLARRALDFGIAAWDPDRAGVLVAPHHNTYDIEFWGPDGLCGTIYVGALSAMASMLQHVGEDSAAASYRAIAVRAAEFLDKHLFNGEYYIQQVTYPEDHWRTDEVSEEKRELLRAEGPCYQAGAGCLSDGVIGAGWAQLYGVPVPLDHSHVRLALAAIHRHNLRQDLSEHANTQRPGYALGREGGLLLCTWPHGGKPSLPFIYSDEVWPGVEYQVATHLILEGMADKGLEIVRIARQRFDGRVRNPWNEYECGSFYARSMASYALLIAWSGLRYSSVTRTLRVAPATRQRPFHCIFCTEGALGTVTLFSDAVLLEILDGSLSVSTVELGTGPRIKLHEQRMIRAGEALRLAHNPT